MFKPIFAIDGLSGAGQKRSEQSSRSTFHDISAELKERGVLANGINPREMRMVTHKDVNRDDCLSAIEAIKAVVSCR